MRLLTISLGLVLLALAGCPRTPGPDTVRLSGTAAHPWQLPGYQEDESIKQAKAMPTTTNASQSEPDGKSVELKTARGPALPSEDTLDESKLPGQWLQVCICMNEQINIPGLAEMDLLDLHSDGSMVWHIHSAQNETAYQEGFWAKPAPGQFSLQMPGGEPVALYGQLYHDQFLYIWSYEQKLGHWFVRMPETGVERIIRNRFKTTFGDMIFTQVGDLGFRGVINGQYERTIGGTYFPGVIVLRWEESATNSAGYAAFLVDPEFKTLDGVWWLDDYEAAPFGGPWAGEADDSIPMPSTGEEETPSE